MDIEENVQESVPVVNQEDGSNEGNGKDIWVILLNVFLALLTIFLLGYIAYKNGYIDLDNILKTKEENSSEDSENGEDNSEVLDAFNGEYISTMIPSDWSIVEYYDGEGTDMLVDGVAYTGLTGLEVLSGDTVIFKMGAVSGIGFVGCSELPIFSDSSDAYLAEMQEINDEVEMSMSTLDYTGEIYYDFNWLGKDFRRVDVYLYFDSVAGNNTFEPQCERTLITVPGLSFEDSSGYEGTAYTYEISETANSEELKMLDKALEGMQKK